jgi:hypothetical protein
LPISLLNNIHNTNVNINIKQLANNPNCLINVTLFAAIKEIKIIKNINRININNNKDKEFPKSK